MRVELAAISITRAFGECHSDAVHHAALDLPARALGIEDVPEVMRGGNLLDLDDPGLRVDCDSSRLADEGRIGERREYDPSGAGRADVLGHRDRVRGGSCDEQLTVAECSRSDLRNRDAAGASAAHARGSVNQLEVMGRCFQLGGRDIEQLLAQLGGGGEQGSSVVESRLAAGAPHVPGAGFGVLVHDRYPRRIEAQLLSRDQSQRHHGAGPVLLRAGHDRGRTVGVQLQLDRRGGREAEPPSTGEADPLTALRSRPVADHLGGLVQALQGGDRLHSLSGRALVAFGQQVAAADLVAVETDTLAKFVRMLLDRPGDLRPGRCTHRPGGRLVRVHRVRLDVQVRYSVRACGHHGGDLGDARRVGRVRPGVEDQAGRPRGHHALAGYAGLQLDDHWVVHLVRGDEFVVTAEHDSHRPSGLLREGRDVGLEVELALPTESTSQVRNDDANAALGNLERLGNAGASGERDLRRGPDRDPVAAPLRHHRVRLDGDRVRLVAYVSLLDDLMGGAEAGRHVAFDDVHVGAVVAVPDDPVIGGVRLPLRVHELAAPIESGLRILHRRQWYRLAVAASCVRAATAATTSPSKRTTPSANRVRSFTALP